jgi:hypothetical protein
MSGSLSRIACADGFVTDVQGLSDAVLLGREFWCIPPEALPQNLLTPVVAAVSDLPLPPAATFQKCIATSLNTSPGIDGVPYAAFRATWTVAVALLQAILLA